MTTHLFKSGPQTDQPRSDLRVSYKPGNQPLSIQLTSKVAANFGDSIHRQAAEKCKSMDVTSGTITLEDFGAFPFVIDARIESVLRRAFPEKRPDSVKYKETSPGSTRDRLRRSRLYIPGNQPKLMVNACIHEPDGIILDLEDSVGLSEKPSARLIARNALRTLNFGESERMVRINQGELGEADLQELVSENVDLFLVPKVESVEQILKVEKLIAELCKSCSLSKLPFLMPILESAKGILHAEEIASASKNIVALAIGLEDYTADLGVPRTPEGKESLWARSMLVNAARSAGIQAIDTVYSDIQDEEGLRNSVREAKSLGFDGKGCIHPRQIRPVHEEFAPSPEEIKKAKAIVAAYKEAEEKGLGVVSLGNKMIDPPVVKRALQTLKNAGRN